MAAEARPRGTRSERNVIYGMYSGAALLLDVYRPAKPNGFGVVFVAGSGFRPILPMAPARSRKPRSSSGARR